MLYEVITMSRIGKAPISLPSGVNVTVKDNTVTVKGPKGELTQNIHAEMTLKVEDNVLTVERPNDTKEMTVITSYSIHYTKLYDLP